LNVLRFARRVESWLLGIIFEPCGTSDYQLSNPRAIDIESDTEIWAEDIESDYDCEFDEAFDGGLLDLNVQMIEDTSSITTRFN
jgi:hypothetical protein